MTMYFLDLISNKCILFTVNTINYNKKCLEWTTNNFLFLDIALNTYVSIKHNMLSG